MKKKLTCHLFILFLSLSIYPNFQSASADSITLENSQMRLSALKMLKNGDQNGILQLNKLSEIGDSRSSFLLGLFFLSGKFVPEKDLKKSEDFLKIAAQNCHRDAVNTLYKMYLTRGSSFFNPTKAKKLKLKCTKQLEKKLLPSDAILPDTLNLDQQLDILDENLPDNKEHYIVTEIDTNNLESNKKKNNSTDSSQKISELSMKPEIYNQIIGEISNKWQMSTPVYKGVFATGSGVAITSEGNFITNFHVIEECSNIAIKYNGLIGKGSIINYNKDLDLAIIQVNAPSPFFARFDVSELKIGEWLFALGFPISEIFGETASFSEGRLTNVEDSNNFIRDQGFLLVSIPIASGNSGGPVFNSNLGLRGIMSYGYDTFELQKIISEKFDSELFINSTNLNFAVSGLRIAKWLENLGIKINYVNKVNQWDNLENVVNESLRYLAKVECY